jgi:hypothetical protein
MAPQKLRTPCPANSIRRFGSVPAEVRQSVTLFFQPCPGTHKPAKLPLVGLAASWSRDHLLLLFLPDTLQQAPLFHLPYRFHLSIPIYCIKGPGELALGLPSGNWKGRAVKMVGVLALAILGVTAYVTLKIVRSFLLNLQRAKKTGLPYVIGRKSSSTEYPL